MRELLSAIKRRLKMTVQHWIGTLFGPRQERFVILKKLPFQNAEAVMRWAFERGERVLFLPDEHLGRNTAAGLGIPLDEMIVWDPYQDFGGNSHETIRRARVILWKSL